MISMNLEEELKKLSLSAGNYAKLLKIFVQNPGLAGMVINQPKIIELLLKYPKLAVKLLQNPKIIELLVKSPDLVGRFIK